MKNIVKCSMLFLVGVLIAVTCYGENKQSPTTSAVKAKTIKGGVFFAQAKPTSDGKGKYELGLKFRVEKPGKIEAFCFYQAKNEKGPHVFKLWSADGKKLLEVNINAVEKHGWVNVPLEKPFAVSVDTEYIVSYTCNKAYVATSNVLTATAPVKKDGIKAVSGHYSKNTSGKKAPDKTHNNMHYFIDIVFSNDIQK